MPHKVHGSTDNVTKEVYTMYDKRYPREVFSIDENRTRMNMRAYDEWEDKVDAECRNRNPDYRKMNLRDRYDLRKEVMKAIPCPV